MELTTQLNSLKRKVDFNTYDISVKEIINWVDEGIIDIAPEYQRQFRWDIYRQSALIESVFLGIPVPSLYMATNTDGTWELVDGVQRISTIIHFAGSDLTRKKLGIGEELTLKGLEKLTSFNGKRYEDLPRSIQFDFILKPLKVTTLSDKSDLDVRFDLFERLNTGGVALTNQEIRSSVFRGQFNDFLQSLLGDQNFNKVVKPSAAQAADGTMAEFVLRFFAYLYNYKEFDHSVVDFLNAFMRNANKKFDYREGKDIFSKTFLHLAKLPHGITRGRSTTPTNLFEGVAVGAALAIKETGTIVLDGAEEWMKSKELTNFTTGATNSKLKVTQRIEYCRDKFLGK